MKPENLKKGDKLKYAQLGHDIYNATVKENFPESKMVYLKFKWGIFGVFSFNKIVKYDSYSLSTAKLIQNS